MRGRRRIDALVRKLVPDPFDLDQFLANASTEMGLPIRMLSGVSSGLPLSGASFVTDRCAFVSVPASTSEDHHIFIVSHEVFHLLEGHSCSAAAEDHSNSLIRSFRRQRIELSCERFAWKVGTTVLRQRVRAVGPAEAPARMLSSAFGFRA